jgi:hypothetical protein
MNQILKRENVHIVPPATLHFIKEDLDGNLKMFCQSVIHSRGMEIVYLVLTGDFERPDLTKEQAEIVYGRILAAATA